MRYGTLYLKSLLFLSLFLSVTSLMAFNCKFISTQKKKYIEIGSSTVGVIDAKSNAIKYALEKCHSDGAYNCKLINTTDLENIEHRYFSETDGYGYPAGHVYMSGRTVDYRYEAIVEGEISLIPEHPMDRVDYNCAQLERCRINILTSIPLPSNALLNGIR